MSSGHLEFDLLSSAIKDNIVRLSLGVSVMDPESEVWTALPSLTPQGRHPGSVPGEKTLVPVRTHGLDLEKSHFC